MGCEQARRDPVPQRGDAPEVTRHGAQCPGVEQDGNVGCEQGRHHPRGGGVRRKTWAHRPCLHPPGRQDGGRVTRVDLCHHRLGVRAAHMVRCHLGAGDPQVTRDPAQRPTCGEHRRARIGVAARDQAEHPAGVLRVRRTGYG